MAHGFFMLRIEELLQWKPKESANKFELLVTSSHDRVFGGMVRAQHAEERKKKEIAYRERKAEEEKENGGKPKEAKEGKEGKGEEKEKKDDEKKDVNKRGDQKEGEGKKEGEKKVDRRNGKDDREKEGDATKETISDKPDKAHLAVTRAALAIGTPAPDSPGSNVKVRDGEEIHPSQSPMVAAVNNDGEHAIVAVPVPAQGKVNEEAEDNKHEVEIVAAAPEKKKDEPTDDNERKKDEPDAKGKEKKAKERKEAREEFDPMRDAELLVKMLQASGGGPDGPLGMEDIMIAFKALERAAESGMARPGGDPKKDKGPLIWCWGDSCERWRWKNFEAGVHDVNAGGWEERDWKVFADDRGCDEFDEDMEVLEIEEEDVHDWSC